MWTSVELVSTTAPETPLATTRSAASHAPAWPTSTGTGSTAPPARTTAPRAQAVLCKRTARAMQGSVATVTPLARILTSVSKECRATSTPRALIPLAASLVLASLTTTGTA
eukprot:Rmarinus@m.13982